MSRERNDNDILSPAPEVVQDFCLEQCYPHYLFRYWTPRSLSDSQLELQLCSVTHAESPAGFIVQLDSDRRKADRISYQLAQCYATNEKRAEFAVTDEFLHRGLPVAVRYMSEADLRWFRAVIVNVDQNPENRLPIRVRFVDFGNFQDCARVHIKLMPIEIGNEPPFAVKCRLKDVEYGEEFDEAVVNNFQSWTYDATAECCRKFLVNVCSFDSLANQVLVRLFDLENGQEFLLPPRPASAFATASQWAGDVQVADESVEFDEPGNDQVRVEQDLADQGSFPQPRPPSTEPDWTTNTNEIVVLVGERRSSGNNSLQDPGSAVATTSDGFASWGKVVADKEVQTLLTCLGQGTPSSAEYDPFRDPRFSELIAKYPNIFKYLYFPDNLPPSNE